MFIHQVLEQQTSSTSRQSTGSSWFLHVPDPVPVRDRNTKEMFLIQTGSRHRQILILSAPVPDPVPVRDTGSRHCELLILSDPVPDPVPVRMQVIYLAAGSSPVPEPFPVRMQTIYRAAGSNLVPDPVPDPVPVRMQAL